MGARLLAPKTKSHTALALTLRGAGAHAGRSLRCRADAARLDAVAQTHHVTKITLPRQDPQPHPEHDQRAEPRELALLAPPPRNRAHDALAIIDMGRRGGEEALR